MVAPTPVLWALSALFPALALPCLYRLVRAHPESDLWCRVDRGDEAAELLMCLGMLAMVSPVGGPIPLAGWQAAFVVSAAALAVTWIRRLRTAPEVSCAPSRCGHHAISAVLMLVILVGMAGHGGSPTDPWLTLAGHGTALGLGPLALAAAAYFFVDIALCVVRMVRVGVATGPRLFAPRSREATRAVMNAAMAGMLLSMV